MTRPAGSLFITQEALAERLGVSRSSIVAAIGRGEVAGVQRIGARVLIAWPAWQLRALGVADVGAFCKGLGIRNLGDLLAFLGEDGDGNDDSRQPSR